MKDSDFADPGGKSALRATTRKTPRNLPCPTCGLPDQLIPADKRLGYRCDRCAVGCRGNHDARRKDRLCNKLLQPLAYNLANFLRTLNLSEAISH